MASSQAPRYFAILEQDRKHFLFKLLEDLRVHHVEGICTVSNVEAVLWKPFQHFQMNVRTLVARENR